MPEIASPPTEIQRTVLPNGVRIVSERMPQVRSVSVGIWLCTGARLEAPQETGICHFLEHLLFKGTRRRSVEEIARSVDSIGGNLDAFTGKEMVSFNAKVLDQHLPVAFDVLADLVTGPLLRPEDVQKEKGVILEEIKMELDNPEYLVHEIFASNFWKGHALGRPILGTRETVQRFTPEMVESYYRRVYIPSNVLVTAAGNLEHERLVELAAEYFRNMPTGDGLPQDQPPVTHARVALRHKKSLEQIHLCLGVPCYPASHKERFAGYLLNTLLGGGMSSRLFQNIREKQGLAYAVFSEVSPYRDTACLSIYAGTSADAARTVVQLILEELSRFKQELVSEEELRRGKDFLKGSLILGLESTGHRMANLARQELYFGRFFSLDELIEDIERVTADDVQRTARQFFDSRLITLTVLGNLNGLRFRREDLAC